MVLGDHENPLLDRYQIKFTGALWGANGQPHIIWVIDFISRSGMSPLPVKGCKILAYTWHFWPLSREGSLSCHTCCDTGPRVFQSHSRDRAIQPLLTTCKGMLRTYSSLGHHGAHLIQIKLLSRDILNKEIFWVCLCTQSYLVLSVFGITGFVNDL
jgi:hypothetical protein